MPAITGNIDSFAATCMAVAASSPAPTNAR